MESELSNFHPAGITIFCAEKLSFFSDKADIRKQHISLETRDTFANQYYHE